MKKHDFDRETIFDILKQRFGLSMIEEDCFNPQAMSAPTEVGHRVGYKGFFGPEVYSTHTFYPRVFRWRFKDGRGFGAMFEPVIIRESGRSPIENDSEMLERLCISIDQTVDSRFVEESLK